MHIWQRDNFYTRSKYWTPTYICTLPKQGINDKRFVDVEICKRKAQFKSSAPSSLFDSGIGLQTGEKKPVSKQKWIISATLRDHYGKLNANFLPSYFEQNWQTRLNNFRILELHCGHLDVFFYLKFINKFGKMHNATNILVLSMSIWIN
jgi:hypothetical protein